MAGRKTKHIEKAAKASKAAVSKKETVEEWDIFTDDFKERLNEFITLNEEVLELKASVEGVDETEEFQKKKKRMGCTIQEAALDILKGQVTSLEDWIKGQQKELNGEIEKIERAYESNRVTLLGTGVFSEEDARNQLIQVQKKADDKKEVNGNYQALLARASSIYE